MLIHDNQLDNDKYNIDEALTYVGSSHRYQKITFLYFSLQWMITYWILGSPTYLFKSPLLKSSFQSNYPTQCKTTESFDDATCQSIICAYKGNYNDILINESVILQYDPPLLCDNKKYRTILEQQVYIGSFLGFFIFSYISDNYGRKPSLGASWLIGTIGGLTIGLATNYWLIGIGLFLCGFGANPSITVHYSFINEQSQGKFREFQAIGIQVFFAIGELALVPISYYFPQWRVLCLYWFTIPMIVLNFPIFFVKESPKFLMHKDQKKTIDLLNEIAKINGRPTIQLNQVTFEHHKLQNHNYWFYDLIRYPSIRTPFLGGALVFVVIQYIFYGLNFSLSRLDTGFFESALVMGVVDLISYCSIDFLIPYIRRKRSIVFCFLATSISCFIYSVIPESANKYVLLVLLGLIRFFITSVWGIAYAYYSEVFPSVIRSLALGMVSAAGTLGSVSSPLNSIISEHLWSPMVPLGVLSVVGMFAAMVGRETHHVKLEDEIEEEDKLEY